MMKLKQKWKWGKFLITLCFVALIFQFLGWGFGSDKSKIIISYQTTRITEPLDENGQVDYIEYLNQQSSDGVTPENNFEYVIRKISRMDIIEENLREEYLKRIGLKKSDILKKENQFQNIYDFLEAKFKTKNNSYEEQDKIENRIYEIIYPENMPRSKKNAALIAEWLELNNKHLDTIVEVSKRSKSYTPYLINPDGDNSIGRLLNIDLAPIHARRDIAISLRMRALNRIGKNDIERAQDDIMAMHRISRLTSNNSLDTSVIYVGSSIESMAYHTELQMLETSTMNKDQIHSYIEQLNTLKTESNYSRTLDTHERFMFLESTMDIANTISQQNNNQDNYLLFVSNKAIDYNSILRWGNKKYDALVKASKIKDSIKRKQSLKLLSNQFSNRVNNLKSSGFKQFKGIIKSGSLANYATDRLRDTIYSLTCPTVADYQDNEFRTGFYLERMKISYALKAYQLDHGQFPDKLDKLTPKYLPEIPLDPFGQKYPIYKTTEKGFIIYSIGPNQIDDKGMGVYGTNYDENPDADDILIEYPKKPKLPNN